jgi:hypothetical protein
MGRKGGKGSGVWIAITQKSISLRSHLDSESKHPSSHAAPLLFGKLGWVLSDPLRKGHLVGRSWLASTHLPRGSAHPFPLIRDLRALNGKNLILTTGLELPTA